MKKGFTLIELLAVIVILAIITLIATPIVLEIINDIKKSAVLRSAEFYLDALENSIATTLLENKKLDAGTYSITEDGNICLGAYINNSCTVDILKIESTGSKAELGEIKVNSEGKYKVSFYIGGYCATKKYNDENVKITKTTKQNCYLIKEHQVVENSNEISIYANEETVLNNYKIYGNYDAKDVNLLKLPYNNNSMNRYGIEYTLNEDGSITASGTAIADSFYAFNNISVKAGTYTVLAAPLEASNDTRPFTFIFHNVGYIRGENKTLNISSDITTLFHFVVYSGNTVENLKIYPMIVEGSEIGEYSPPQPSGGYDIPIIVQHENGSQETYNINLSRPLSCINELCDYIDFERQLVIRKNGEEETLEIPKIKLKTGLNKIKLDINPVSTKIEIIK